MSDTKKGLFPFKSVPEIYLSLSISLSMHLVLMVFILGFQPELSNQKNSHTPYNLLLEPEYEELCSFEAHQHIELLEDGFLSIDSSTQYDSLPYSPAKLYEQLSNFLQLDFGLLHIDSLIVAEGPEMDYVSFPIESSEVETFAVWSDTNVFSHRSPPYPVGARQLGLQGLVLMLIYINEEGKITAYEIVKSSGHFQLDQAALRYVNEQKAVAVAQIPQNSQPWQILYPIIYRID
ncbi:MAG: energy transducer TonB [Verrucomicrobiota bacterium]